VDVMSLLLVLGVLSIFALFVGGMIWYERRKRRDRQQIAQALGFQPLDELDQDTTTRLIQLHQHTSSQDLKVHNPSERREASTRIVLFDLMDHSGDSNSTLVDAGIAIFSNELRLPRFSLIPRVAEKGRLAEIANRFLEMLIEKRSNRIQLGKNAHFDERYFLLGDDREAIEAFLDEYRLSRLSQSTYRHLEAKDDFFTYSRFVFATRGKRDRQTDLKKDLGEARVLLDLLSS
jgi:hypothetical protein